MKRFGVDPSSIDAMVVTHLHGDHFGGYPSSSSTPSSSPAGCGR
jgi:ribonuclease BN (tRNA processing enzyme)